MILSPVIIVKPDTYQEWRGKDLNPLSKLLVSCQSWWAARGVFFSTPEPLIISETIYNTDDNDITLIDNPWYDTLTYLIRSGHTMDKDHIYLVILDNWDSNKYAGWGGFPLALTGEWLLRVLDSSGSQESIVDDWLGGFLVCHEIGHALGLPHDFITENSVMGYSYTSGYNFVLGPLWNVIQARSSLKTEGCKLNGRWDDNERHVPQLAGHDSDSDSGRDD